MTELLANEYFQENPFLEEKSYQFEIIMVKILCDIVGPEVILETYSTGNLKKLEEVLSKKIGLSDSHEFLENINKIFEAFDRKEEVKKEELEKIIDVFDNYYKDNSKEDLEKVEGYAYYRKIISQLSKEDPINNYYLILLRDGYYVKPYFSTKLKEQYPSPYLAAYNTSPNFEVKEYKK